MVRMGTAKTMTIKRPQRRTKRSAHGQVREGAQAPLVPAKAGTQLLLDSRLRGNERRNRGLSEDKATEAGDLNGSALYRLMAWLSPAYPIGAFSYSSGIEWAVEAGDITDAARLKRWLAGIIADGRAARSRRARTRRGGKRRARERHRARRGRRCSLSRRYRRHAPREPAHAAIQELSHAKSARPAARRYRRPSRLGQDRTDGCVVQAAARPL